MLSRVFFSLCIFTSLEISHLRALTHATLIHHVSHPAVFTWTGIKEPKERRSTLTRCIHASIFMGAASAAPAWRIVRSLQERTGPAASSNNHESFEITSWTRVFPPAILQNNASDLRLGPVFLTFVLWFRSRRFSEGIFNIVCVLMSSLLTSLQSLWIPIRFHNKMLQNLCLHLWHVIIFEDLRLLFLWIYSFDRKPCSETKKQNVSTYYTKPFTSDQLIDIQEPFNALYLVPWPPNRPTRYRLLHSNAEECHQADFLLRPFSSVSVDDGDLLCPGGVPLYSGASL